MKLTSNWPLPESGERLLLPPALTEDMALNPLTSGCYPLALGYYPKAHGHQMARARPQDYLVIYCVDGTAQLQFQDQSFHVRSGDLLLLLQFQDQSFHVRSGDLLLLPPGKTHAYQAADKTPWSLYWVHLDGTDLATLAYTLDPESRGILHPGLHEQLISDFRALMTLIASGHSAANMLHAGSLCRSILTYAALLQARAPQRGETLDIDALHHLMQQRISERLTLDELTRSAGMTSPWQFIRRYRALTGQTPMQAFLHRKIARASYLLEVSDLPVAEIALRLGFDDPYYFSRAFKKITGISPTQYRRQGVAQ